MSYLCIMNKRLVGFLIVFIASIPAALAQGCSVCTKTASGLGESSAQGLNKGILYLAAIPLIFMITMGIIWYKRTKASDDDKPVSFRY